MQADFDLNLFVVFQTLMEERSVTNAGDRLGRTQSAISNSLRRLRQVFGDPLFVRSPGGLIPTPRAEEISRNAAAILQLVEDAVAPRQAHDPVTAVLSFAIGAPDRLSLPIFLPLIRKLRDEAPGIRIDLRTTDKEFAVEQVESGGLHLAIGWFDDLPASLDARHLFDEELVCLCDGGHPVARAQALSLDRLMDFPHVVVTSAGDRRAAFDSILARQGRARRAAATLTNFTLVPGLLAGSDLVGVFTRRVAAYMARNYGLAVVPLSTDIPAIGHQMIWHRRFAADPGHAWLRERIVAVCGG